MMRRIDIETVLICAVMAMVGAVGLVAGTAAFFGIRFRECNGAILIGICVGLVGIIWGILLIFNRNQLEKRAKI